MGWEDSQFGAVFGDGAAGDWNSPFPEHFLEGGIGIGFGGTFPADDFRENFFGPGVGDGGFEIIFPTQGSGEKEAKGNDAVGSPHIFIGDGPTDGGFVDADLASDFRHG